MVLRKSIEIFEPDLAGMLDIGTSPEWKAWCEEVAQAIIQIAHAEGSSVGGTGQYQNSWHGAATLVDGPPGKDLPSVPYFIALASNEDWHSVFAEFGAKPSKRLRRPKAKQRGGHVKHINAKHVLLHAFERVIGALEA